jgi:hypothetical protein
MPLLSVTTSTTAGLPEVTAAKGGTWMLGYPDLITPGATYASVVDNRAWG